MPNDNLELLKFYRGEIKFESDLLSGRLNSFISSQSFLLIAYGGSMTGSSSHWHTPFVLLFPPMLSLLGLALATQALPGIRAARAVIGEWQKRQDKLCEEAPDLREYSFSLDKVLEQRRQQGSVFARHAPHFFIAAWCYFIPLPFLLYFMARS